MLLVEAGIRVRDSTSVFRFPYWHSQGADGGSIRVFTSGLYDNYPHNSGRKPVDKDTIPPMDHVVIAPAPWLYMRKVFRCCGFGLASCHKKPLRCDVADWRSDKDCCFPLYPRIINNPAYPFVARCEKTQKTLNETHRAAATANGHVLLQPSNCSHFKDIFYGIPSEPYQNEPNASCVLRQPPHWAPAFAGKLGQKGSSVPVRSVAEADVGVAEGS